MIVFSSHDCFQLAHGCPHARLCGFFAWVICSRVSWNPFSTQSKKPFQASLSSCEINAWKKFRPERSGLNFFQALISQLLKLCLQLWWSIINHSWWCNNIAFISSQKYLDVQLGCLQFSIFLKPRHLIYYYLNHICKYLLSIDMMILSKWSAAKIL